MYGEDYISVIMSTFNETKEELSMSIKSILNQSYNKFEFIIICDNPNNIINLNLLRHFQSIDNRIRLHINKKNIGLARSLNIGIEMSKYELIARMDADDISIIDRLQKQYDYLNNNINCSVLATKMTIIDENNNIIKYYDNSNLSYLKIKKLLMYDSPIVHSSVMMRKSIILKIGSYRNISSAQDYEMWLRLIFNDYEIHVLNEQLIFYKIRTNSIGNLNRYNQHINKKYSKYLYINLKKGKDKFSKANLEWFHKKYRNNNLKCVNNYNNSYVILHKGLNAVRKNRFFLGLYYIMLAIIRHPEIKTTLIDSIIYKKILGSK